MAETRSALILSGPFGLGHDMLADACAAALVRCGWRTRIRDSMALLGSRSGPSAEGAFARLMSVPWIYDGLHFAHLRTGSRLATWMEHAASKRLLPELASEIARDPVDLVLSVFATAASAAAKLDRSHSRCAIVTLCPDVAAHRLWVADGADLFMVTSSAAAASVRRYLPEAKIVTIPTPVRKAFYEAPAQAEARARFCIPPEAPCVLIMDSGWGFAPLVAAAESLARGGLQVLAVAGRNRVVEDSLRKASALLPGITPFGFTTEVPALMAAADLIIAFPGAATCAEARVVGRPLLLLDVMPGHGRDNLLHELELGDAHVCVPTSDGIAKSARAILRGLTYPPSTFAPEMTWEKSFVCALQGLGLDLALPQDDSASKGQAAEGAPIG